MLTCCSFKLKFQKGKHNQEKMAFNRINKQTNKKDNATYWECHVWPLWRRRPHTGDLVLTVRTADNSEKGMWGVGRGFSVGRQDSHSSPLKTIALKKTNKSKTKTKKPSQVPWPHYYIQYAPTPLPPPTPRQPTSPAARTERGHRKKPTTHIWLEKEEATTHFLGNELHNLRREKRKHLWSGGGGVVSCLLCVWKVSVSADGWLSICMCARVCVYVCVHRAPCAWAQHLLDLERLRFNPIAVSRGGSVTHCCQSPAWTCSPLSAPPPPPPIQAALLILSKPTWLSGTIWVACLHERQHQIASNLTNCEGRRSQKLACGIDLARTDGMQIVKGWTAGTSVMEWSKTKKK